ncbi:MAG: asparagine--tRNA ligase [Leptospirales bacterium]|nr:asparagine--tRNA ligase [Leptospirales bacterium]
MELLNKRTPLIKDILSMEPSGQSLSIEGWVRTVRKSKGVAFAELNDGSCLRDIQLVIDESSPCFESLNKIGTGASLRVSGTLVSSQGQGQKAEIKAETIEVIGETPPDYVLQKKKHSFEFLREIAHLRPRTNSFGAVARVRNEMSYAIHTFFQERGFIYVHTPIITGSDCEGAGEMFQVTTLPLENIPKTDGLVDYSKDFFGKRSLLTVSGQLEGETYAMALKNIYTFGPTFRAENSNTSRHLAEFWMIEPEMAFCDINGNMDTAEEFLKYIFERVLKNRTDDMDFFNERISPGVIDNLQGIIKNSFIRTTYTECIDILLKEKDRFEFPVKWGIDMQSEHEKFLTEDIYKSPVIVTDYPKEIKAFYMKQNSDNKTVRGMDVLVPRLGEIIGGSEREADYDKLLVRIKEAGLDPNDYWWYLDLRRFGSAPHSGFGLGFERLIQFITGMKNIRDVIPYPRSVGSLEF